MVTNNNSPLDTIQSQTGITDEGVVAVDGNGQLYTFNSDTVEIYNTGNLAYRDDRDVSPSSAGDYTNGNVIAAYESGNGVIIQLQNGYDKIVESNLFSPLTTGFRDSNLSLDETETRVRGSILELDGSTLRERSSVTDSSGTDLDTDVISFDQLTFEGNRRFATLNTSNNFRFLNDNGGEITTVSAISGQKIAADSIRVYVVDGSGNIESHSLYELDDGTPVWSNSLSKTVAPRKVRSTSVDLILVYSDEIIKINKENGNVRERRSINSDYVHIQAGYYYVINNNDLDVILSGDISTGRLTSLSITDTTANLTGKVDYINDNPDLNLSEVSINSRANNLSDSNTVTQQDVDSVVDAPATISSTFNNLSPRSRIRFSFTVNEQK